MRRIAILGQEIGFPHQSAAQREPNGLLAAGGDLSVDRLVCAYENGIFPWFSQGEPILWWSPDPRMILRPERFHLSRSLTKRIRRADFTVTFNQAFETVITACAETRRWDGTWITGQMREAYIRLHQAGHAASVEVTRDGTFLGGLYGVQLGKNFFGESMVSLERDASKLALQWLCTNPEAPRTNLIDCQVPTAHLASLGAEEIPRDEFLREVRANLG